MRTYVNKYDIEINSGDYWTMHSPANNYFSDHTWIMKINRIQHNGLVSVDYVNWKRKGGGKNNYSRMVEDFGGIKNLLPSTNEEIDYFNRRIG